jgi:hypothetical protein
MPEYPALPLNPPLIRDRVTRPGPRPKLHGPGAGVQAGRLAPAFNRLNAAFEAERLALAEDPAALEPEQVLVLEVGGELDEFARAVRRIEGLEFLAEQLEDKIEPDEFVVLTGERVRPYVRQLFLVASDHRAWQELLRLWQRFKNGEAMPHGLTKFRDLFDRLRDLRPWEDRDRLERTGVLAAWQEELADVPDGDLVSFEVELWIRKDQQRRDAAIARLRTDLLEAGGELVDSVLIEEIGYHGVLGRVPAALLRQVLSEHQVRWMSTEGVRFFHAVGQIFAPALPDAELEAPVPVSPALPQGNPVIALLDGVPLANHGLLRERIVLDDPDGWEATTPAVRRQHGTSMASLILHGDLGADTTPLSTPLYARPVLTADAPAWVSDPREEFPRDRLPVDLVHQAVARLYEGDDPASPGVKAIVLAVGDSAQPFERFVSPLARLVDWLSFRYRVTFFIAAGNQLEPLSIPADTGLDDPQELQHELLCAIQRSAALRRLLSPAESINALTVGASHSDHAITPEDDRHDPIVTPDLPSPISPLGSGVGRAIKPDILLAGGRQMVRLEPAQDGHRLVTMPPSARPPGARVATPGLAGDLNATASATGTSVAAALGGHQAGQTLDVIAELRGEHENFPAEEYDSVLLKAAMVHGAAWGSAGIFIRQVQDDLNLDWSRDSVARFVGYGHVASHDILNGSESRITVLAAGSIPEGAGHAYKFPLPPSLSAQAVRRRVTLTLAWLTPINPFHRGYRRAALTLEPGGVENYGDLLGDRVEALKDSSRRGTVQHEVHEGASAVPYAPGSELELVVSCRAAAGALDQIVPYAALATIEVPEELALPIYQEVRQALRPQIPAARPRAG